MRPSSSVCLLSEARAMSDLVESLWERLNNIIPVATETSSCPHAHLCTCEKDCVLVTAGRSSASSPPVTPT